MGKEEKTKESPAVEELAELVEQFMAAVPPGIDERDWSSIEMAKAIIKAGYSKKGG
jgi:ribosome-binding protein aMBF1 (putative translation factor)